MKLAINNHMQNAGFVMTGLLYFLLNTGGLTAVIWTDFIQVVIMVLGAFILMIMSKYTIHYSELFHNALRNNAVRYNAILS